MITIYHDSIDVNNWIQTSKNMQAAALRLGIKMYKVRDWKSVMGAPM